MSVHKTERLTLRPLGIDDRCYLAEMDSDRDVMEYIRPAIPYDDAFIAASRYYNLRAPAGGGVWAIERSCDQRFVGWVFLIYLNDTPEVELGYRLLSGMWGKGYATEAARCMAAYAMENLKLGKLVAVTHPDNKPSWNVLIKTGLTHRGIKRAYDFDCEYFVLENTGGND